MGAGGARGPRSDVARPPARPGRGRRPRGDRLLLDVPADSFGVEVEPELEGPSGELLHVARIARERAELAQEEARATTIAAVQTFAGQGMTVRDIGRLIGVSHQQAAKLLRRGARAGSLSEAGSTR